MPVLVQLALRIALASLVAVGGANAVIPQLRRIAIDDTHWMDARTFAQLVGIAQAAPGPNLLLVPLIGYRVAGWPGALVALGAFLAVAGTIAVCVSRWLAKHHHTAWVQTLRRTLRPVAAGLLIASAVSLAQIADAAGRAPVQRVAYPVVAIVVGVAAARLKWNPLVYIAGAAIVGLLLPAI
jgi:chromate transporter